MLLNQLESYDEDKVLQCSLKVSDSFAVNIPSLWASIKHFLNNVTNKEMKVA